MEHKELKELATVKEGIDYDLYKEALCQWVRYLEVSLKQAKKVLIEEEKWHAEWNRDISEMNHYYHVSLHYRAC